MSVATNTGYYPKAILFAMDQSNVKIIKEYPNIRLDKVRQGTSSDELGIMYRFKEDVRKYSATNDTIFTIGQDTEMNDAFIFELGKYKLPLAFIEGKLGHDWDLRDTFITLLSIHESLNHLFIEFLFGKHAPEPVEKTGRMGNHYFNTKVCGVFDKRTGALTLLRQPIKGKIGFKNDIDNGPVIWPRYISSKNELVTYVSADEFMDYYEKIENPTPQLTEVAKKIKWDDNQIVIIAKLKE